MHIAEKGGRVQRGFTLIELLVVISIIALLSSLVLASLSSARDKAADSAIKSNLSTARTNSFLFYDATGGYSQMCTAATLAPQYGVGPNVQAAEIAYDGTATVYSDTVASTWNTAQCHELVVAGEWQWVAWVPLRSSTSGAPRAWCVDTSGTARLSTAVLPGMASSCP